MDQPLVLIVDDDADIVESLAYRLSQQGFATCTAGTGNEAILRARCDHPAAILLDLGLPDMDGLAVCEELVDSSETCEIPIIVVSGADRHDILRRCRSAGCRFFLRKPYDPDALLTLLRQAIRELREW